MLDQYERCRAVLARELAVRPEPETENVRAAAQRLSPPESPEADRDVPLDVAVPSPPSSPRSGRPSIAVLPFGGEDAAASVDLPPHLCEGVAEEIAIELGRFREFDVIAPASALVYRHATVSPARAGAELGAAYVLDGALRQSGQGLRLTVCLTECASGRQLWAERYDVAPTGLLEVGDEVLRRIIATLAGQVEDARLTATRPRRLEHWEAYDLYLRGWSALRRGDLAGIREARDCFRGTLARDPNFARGYVGLVMTQFNEWACYAWNHWAIIHDEALMRAQGGRA